MIGYAGLSHLGIVSSAATAAKGFDVICFGDDPELCEQLNRGNPNFFEPGLEELLVSVKERTHFTSEADELSRCKVIYFSLDVSTDENGRSDLSSLHKLIDSVVAVVGKDTTLVVLSQVPPGFTRTLKKKIEQITLGWNLELFYQVETLIFGRAVERALYPERVIVGSRDPRHQRPANVYAEMLATFNCPILTMRYESAELTKICINMCLVSSISVANTMAQLCEKIGADWAEIIPALRLDKRIGEHAYLSPGLGIAGGNLERDLATVVALANDLGTDDGVVDAWISNSRYRRSWVLRLLHHKVISRLKNPTFAIWGLAYKEDTSSTKNSPALSLIDSLKPFSVRAYDPQVLLDVNGSARFVQTASAIEACRGTDALAIMTPWREFSSFNVERIKEAMIGRVIIDPYGVLNSIECVESGFSYFKLGHSGDVKEE